MVRVLVIDDEETVRHFLKVVLEKEGHQVWEASDGKEGMRHLHKEPADLVFCDLFMPGQEGMETIRQLRRDFPGLPVVAMSGNLSREIMLETAVLLGANTAMAKPFTRAEVLAATAMIATIPDGKTNGTGPKVGELP